MPEPKQFIKIKNPGGRVHPQYNVKDALWNFLLASWRGGLGMGYRAGITEQQARDLKFSGYYPGLFRFKREALEDYVIRVAHTPYTPLARQIVEEYVRYVTKDGPERTGAESFAELIANTDCAGRPMDMFMRDILALALVMGEVGLLVDMPPAIEPVVSQAAANAQGLRAYAGIVLPQNIVDWSIGRNGKYEWLIIETVNLVNSIAEDKAKIVKRRTYWDSQVWQKYELTPQSETKKKDAWNIIDGAPHPCGEVPIIRIVTNDIDQNALTPESWFFDLADMNRAIYNLDSLDLANLFYQTFGILVLPPSDKDEVPILSRAHALTEEPATSGITRFVQTSGAEGVSFDRKISELKLRMYMTAGLQYQTGKAVPESGISKQWDFQRVNQFLAGMAKMAEFIENRMSELAAKWEGHSAGYMAVYPKDYSVQELSQTVEGVLGIKQIGFGSETGRKEALKHLYREVLPDLSDETLLKIDAEIDASEEANPLAGFDMTRTEPDETTQKQGDIDLMK